MPALAGFGPLCHFDLQLLGLAEVQTRDAETPRCHLLDGAAQVVAVGQRFVAAFVFSALAGVAFSAQAVHGNGQCGVRFPGNGPKRHGACGKAAIDVFSRFHFFYRYRRALGVELEQAAERDGLFRLIVNDFGVFFEGGVIVLPGGVLQQMNALRIEQMHLSAPLPLKNAAFGQTAALLRSGPERPLVLHQRFAGYLVQAHAFDARNGPGEVLVHHFPVDADDLENLSAHVRLQGGNAHFGKHLQEAFLHGFDVILFQFCRRQFGVDAPVLVQIADAGQSHVRVDGRSPEAQQTGEVMHFPHVAGFYHDAHLAPVALADEVVVNGRGEEQRGNGRVFGVNGPVGEHEHFEAVFHRVHGIAAHAVEGFFERTRFAVGAEIHLQGFGLKNAGVYAADFFQFVVGHHRMRQGYGVAHFGVFLQNVADIAHKSGQRHDGALADGVNGRVGDLRKELFEIIRQVLRAVAEDGQRNVGAHTADGFFAVQGHRQEDVFEVFGSIAEGLLVFEHLRGFERSEGDAGIGQFLNADFVFFQPLGIRPGSANFLFDLLVADDAALHQIHQKHLAGLQSAFFSHNVRRQGQHARFGSQYDALVVGDEVAGGAQAVAI